MKQPQLERILKSHIDIPGIAKDLLSTSFADEVKKRTQKPGVRFVDNKNGTITDTKTGLIWIKNPHTDLPEGFKERMDWQQAINACAKLNFASHKDWRLPTSEELISIIDWTRGAKDNEPTIDVAIFPNTKCSYYWTATTCPWSSGSAWLVDFDGGHVNYYNKDASNYVRPVRTSK